jgi:hypothetical protein
MEQGYSSVMPGGAMKFGTNGRASFEEAPCGYWLQLTPESIRLPSRDPL